MPRNKKRQFRFLYTLAILVAAGGLFFMLWRYMHPAHKPKIWTGFGITIPAKYMVHGIDVSRYQNDIDWQYVQAMEDQDRRLSFVFMKATESNVCVDSKFERNWQLARENNLRRGAYHFFDPNQDGALQAQFFIDHVALDSADLPPVLDVERMGNATPAALRENLCTWLNLVEQHYGIKPIVYSNLNFYKTNLSGFFEDYPLWLAQYQQDTPTIKRGWTFWQHSDHGRVNGIDAFVDFNAYSGDSASFSKLLYTPKKTAATK
jgi:lysozyme